MNIGVDARFIQDPYSSIGVFQRNIIKNLLALDRNNIYYVFLTREGQRFIESSDKTQVVILKNMNLLLTNRTITKEATRLGLDLFFATFNISPRFSHNVKVILQTHDFSHGVQDLTIQTLLPAKLYRYLHVKSVQTSDFLLANSSFTKKELEPLSRWQPIRVIYHDCAPEFKQESSFDKVRELTSHEVILYAGRVAPRYKNIRTLLKAFSIYSKTRAHAKLVIVHSDHFRVTDKLYLLRNRQNVTLSRKMSRDRLIQMYRTAKMFIYPSRYEGFGSPMLEAQNSGCPLIANRAQPLPEVAGDGALYYDGSPKELASRMLQLAQDDALRQDLVYKGIANAQRFDWRTTAEETLECLNSLA
jgi:glycosyltransferase involved in cell wall biosynthesis